MVPMTLYVLLMYVVCMLKAKDLEKLKDFMEAGVLNFNQMPTMI